MNLKRFLLFLVVLLLMFTVKISQAAENQTSTKYWYQVIIAVQESSQSVSYLGSSSLSENEFIMLLNGQTPIFLSDLVAMASNGKMKAISEEFPFLTNTIYINPKYIVAVYPLKGDPREEKH